jgi:dienelactone hydrolase
MGASAKRVTFESEGTKLIGDLYMPQERPAGRLPAMIVTGSWLTVKEQMPALYAERMAAEGFASLAFDFRGWGESEGKPRFHESPAKKARDMRNAVAFLQEQPEIDPARVGALAICASSGYAALAATEDSRLRSLVMVAPWLHNAELVRLIYGGETGVQERLEKGRSAKSKYERSGEVDVVVAASASDTGAAMYGNYPYYLDASRGAIKAWDNKMAVMSWIDWLEFDAIRIAPRLEIPTLMVHAEEAAIPDGVKAFHAAMRAPKELRWTNGDQFAFYDQNPQVSFSVKAAAEHFRTTMTP